MPFFDKKQAAKEADDYLNEILKNHMEKAKIEFQKVLPPEKLDERLKQYKNEAKVEIIKIFKKEARKMGKKNLDNEPGSRIALSNV